MKQLTGKEKAMRKVIAEHIKEYVSIEASPSILLVRSILGFHLTHRTMARLNQLRQTPADRFDDEGNLKPVTEKVSAAGGGKVWIFDGIPTESMYRPSDLTETIMRVWLGPQGFIDEFNTSGVEKREDDL